MQKSALNLNGARDGRVSRATEGNRIVTGIVNAASLSGLLRGDAARRWLPLVGRRDSERTSSRERGAACAV